VKPTNIFESRRNTQHIGPGNRISEKRLQQIARHRQATAQDGGCQQARQADLPDDIALY